MGELTVEDQYTLKPEISSFCGKSEKMQEGGGTVKRKKKFACPVCGKLLHEKNLPDKKGFIDERLYHVGGFRIIANTVLECDFIHFWDEEEDRTVDEPHDLTATVDVAFDQAGECTDFVIVEIHAAEDAKSQNSIERR